MCVMCGGGTSCLCNYCVAFAEAKPCPNCHHLRVFYRVRVDVR